MKRLGVLILRKRWLILGTIALLLGIAAVIRPARTPSYLENTSAKESGWGWEVYETPDTNEAIATMLERDWSRQDLWTNGGNITYVDVCNNYMSNRFLYIEWGWPRKDLLRIEVRRRSLLEGLFSH